MEADSTLYKTPFINIGTEYLILPTELITAIEEYTHRKASELGVSEQLYGTYQQNIAKDIRAHLILLGCNEITFPIAEHQDGLQELLFEADTDKAYYLQVQELSPKVPNISSEILKDRAIALATKIKERYPNLLLISVPSAVLPTFSVVSFPDFSAQQIKHLVFSPEDIQIILHAHTFNALTFWQFSEALENISTPPLSETTSAFAAWVGVDNDKFSFYFNDDRRPDMINFDLSNWATFRRKIIAKNDLHYTASPKRGYYAPVIKYSAEENLPRYFSIADPSTWYVESAGFRCWVIGDNDFPNNKPFLDLLSYWLSKWTRQIDTNTPCALNIYLQFDKLFREKVDSAGPPFEICISRSSFEIRLKLNTASIFISEGNDSERLIMRAVFDAISTLFTHIQSTDQILDAVIPAGIGKRIQINVNNYSASEDYIPQVRFIQNHEIEKILDALLSYPGLENIDIANTSAVDISRRFYDALLSRLTEKLKVYDRIDFTKKVLLLYETALSSMENIRSHKASEFTLAHDQNEYFDELSKRISNYNQILKGCRTLLEISFHECRGYVSASTTDVDECLALTDKLLTFGEFGNIAFHNICGVKYDRLSSGRLGIASEWRNFSPTYFYKHTSEQCELAHCNSIDRLSHKADKQFDIKELENAFTDEFGFRPVDLTDFAYALYLYSSTHKESVSVARYEALTSYLHENNFTKEIAAKIISKLSFSLRSSYSEIPVGYTSSDIFPLNYRRRLSILYKPLFIDGDLASNPQILWGFRELDLAIKEIFTRIGDGTYSDAYTDTLKALLGKYQNEAADRFVKDVVRVIEKPEIKVLQDEYFSNGNENLGDVDILVTDKINNRLCIIECKDISSGRNTKEIASEIKNLFEGEKSYLRKHLKRVKYFEENRNIISKLYAIDKTFRIYHCFVVSETLPTMMLHQNDVKFITFLELSKKPDIFSFG